MSSRRVGTNQPELTARELSNQETAKIIHPLRIVLKKMRAMKMLAR